MADVSPDLQALLNRVAEGAARTCGADDATVWVVEDDAFHQVAHYGTIEQTTRDVVGYAAPGVSLRTLLQERRTVHVPDVWLDESAFGTFANERMRAVGVRTTLQTPLVVDDALAGFIAIRRREQRAFTSEEIAQLETYAQLAAVALDRARVAEERDGQTRAVEEKARELAEALQQQTATSEVLSIISRSPTDLQAALDTIARHAARVCDCLDVAVALVEGDQLRGVAHYGPLNVSRTYPLSATGMSAAALRERRTIAMDDALHSAEFPAVLETVRANGIRSRMGVPLLRGDRAIGVILARRTEVRPFTLAEIRLAESFADQAVIAIENARLFAEVSERTAELRGALERQTATSEVLGVIARSPTDTQQVFSAITEAAARVCGAAGAVLRLGDGDHLRVAARFGSTNVGTTDLVPIAEGLKPVNISGTARAVAMRGTVRSDRQFTYLPNGEAWSFPDPEFWPVGHVSISVPLLKGGEALGALIAQRNNFIRSDDNEAALLETFADQAVIALENARLFRELEATNAELEVASRHKSDFLSHMSHDLRTPLNAVISFSEILQEDAIDAGQEQFIPDLQEITTAGKHLLRLINDILDLSKIEAGKMDVLLEEFDVGVLVHEVQAMAQPLVAKNGNTFVVDCADDVGRMTSDLTKVRQGLLNLLSNAAKFTEGGTITLRVERDPPPPSQPSPARGEGARFPSSPRGGGRGRGGVPQCCSREIRGA